MEKFPESVTDGSSQWTQQQYPSFEEHLTQMQNEDNVEGYPDTTEHSANLAKTPEERQVEDLEVLFSFCDEKDILAILKSDSYGVLLDNEVSLVDLFNANALFDEQYYGDGYTTDIGWRNSGYDQLDEDGNHIPADRTAKARHKREDREFQIRQTIRYREVLLKGSDEDRMRYFEEERKGLNPDSDIERAKEAAETINFIADAYFGDNASLDRITSLKDAIQTKANTGKLTKEQRKFLIDEHNAVADRLLYDGHVTTKERAANIAFGLDTAIQQFDDAVENAKADADVEYARQELAGSMLYTKASIDDFIAADKADLVYDTRQQLAMVTDEHFDVLVSTNPIHLGGGDIDRHDAIDGLVFGYSNPFALIDKAKELNLCGKRDYRDDTYHIDDPDRIVDYIGNHRDIYDEAAATTYIARRAQDLKDLGVSDEAIMRNCHNLHPTTFITAASYYEGAGAQLVEAGIDKSKIIKEVFSSSGHSAEPFEKSNDPFNDESYVDILERNGFEITDIAKTFSSDVIARNLEEFIQRGADAKALMKYIAHYREVDEDNIVRNADGEIVEYHHLWHSGIRKTRVWNENHPESIVVEKEAMIGNGDMFIALNLDTFAENGVTEEDILKETHDALPFGLLIPKMLECDKFDKHKILTLGFEKYIADLRLKVEAGVADRNWVEKVASSPSDYYARIVESMSGIDKEMRDEQFHDIAKALESAKNR